MWLARFCGFSWFFCCIINFVIYTCTSSLQSLMLLSCFSVFFRLRWVHAPDCDGCGNKTVSHGMGVPDPTETRFGASRVELYG